MDAVTWAKENFAKDIFATETAGIEILSVGIGYAKCRMLVRDCHKNAADVVMGGAIFTLADFTFAVSANTPETLTVSLSAQINFLRGGTGRELIAEATCVKDGKSTCYYEVVVLDENQKLIAKVSVNGYKRAR